MVSFLKAPVCIIRDFVHMICMFCCRKKGDPPAKKGWTTSGRVIVQQHQKFDGQASLAYQLKQATE